MTEGSSSSGGGLATTLQRINTFALGLTVLVGVVGNIWVIWKVGVVFVFSRGQTGVPRQILLCLLFVCVADLLVLVDLLLLVHFQLTGHWVFGDVVCKMFYCIEVVNKVVIPLGLVQISRVSYRLLFSSVQLCQTRSRGSRLLLVGSCIAAVTVVVLTAYVGYFAETVTFRRRGDLQDKVVCGFIPPPIFRTAFDLLAFFVGYVMTSAAYIYFYMNVPIILKRRCSTTITQSSRLNQSSLLRIRRTVTAFVVVYLICWTPYWLLFCVLSFINYMDRWLVIVSTYAHLLPYVSCTAYPIVLTALNKGIRTAHSNIITTKKRQLTTIRHGAMQVMVAHVGMFHTWLHDPNAKTDNLCTSNELQIGTCV